jgi:hypothetical protein
MDTFVIIFQYYQLWEKFVNEKTNLYRALGQSIEWIYGSTGIEFKIDTVKLSCGHPTGDNPVFFPYEITTNLVRFGNMKHPFALVAESLRLVITGVCSEHGGNVDFSAKNFNYIDWDDTTLMRMILQSNRSGYSPVSIQHRIFRHDGSEDAMARQFLFRYNLLHQVS